MVTSAIATVLETVTTVFDGRPAYDHVGPHIILVGPQTVPGGRQLPGGARRLDRRWQAMCVSNNPDGCRVIAAAALPLLDGTIINNQVTRVINVTAPAEDRDDPHEWRWISIIEIQQTGATQ